MLRRVDGDDQRRHHVALAPAESAAASTIVPAIDEPEDDASLLPRDHPKWQRDAVSLSQRAREFAAALRPVVVKIMTFWDHRIRSAFVGGNRVSIDASGSYRLD